MSFLTFTETPNPDKKTRVWDVKSASNGSFLGRIDYMSGWRKYAFAPAGETIFDYKCLNEITYFLLTHKDDRQ